MAAVQYSKRARPVRATALPDGLKPHTTRTVEQPHVSTFQQRVGDLASPTELAPSKELLPYALTTAIPREVKTQDLSISTEYAARVTPTNTLKDSTFPAEIQELPWFNVIKSVALLHETIHIQERESKQDQLTFKRDLIRELDKQLELHRTMIRDIRQMVEAQNRHGRESTELRTMFPSTLPSPVTRSSQPTNDISTRADSFSESPHRMKQHPERSEEFQPPRHPCLTLRDVFLLTLLVATFLGTLSFLMKLTPDFRHTYGFHN
jgi:hypothetical protein